jgi:FkbM family methyltransferase
MKSLLRPLKRIVEIALGIRIYKILPRGIDFIFDVKRISGFSDMDELNIFDVGANIGQSAMPFANAFKRSNIYCFEPGTLACAKLHENIRKHRNIKVFQTAIGSKIGSVKLELELVSTRNRIVSTTDASNTNEAVSITTLDKFCDELGIDRIDILKIDTEGHDFEVLKGAANLLSDAKIRIIYAEVGLHPTNDTHVDLALVKSYMESFGYFVYGIYEQKHEWKLRHPYLRRINIGFISPTIAAYDASDNHASKSKLQSWPLQARTLRTDGE